MQSKNKLRNGMRLTTLSLLCGFTVACSTAETPVVFADDNLSTGEHGIVATETYLNNLKLASDGKITITEVTDGIYVYQGFGISNMTVIEGDDGLIIVDSGDHIDEGKARLAAIREMTDKPIKAIIYSHNHYSGGTQGMLTAAEQANVEIIAHKDLDRLKTEFSNGLLGTTTLARAAYQMGMYLPDEGQDASPFGSIRLSAHKSGYIKPTKTVSNREIVEIAGIKMQFFTEYRADTTDSIFAYLPEKKTVINNHSLPIFPNLYSLRGQTFRNPKTWIEGIDIMRELDLEHVIVTHGKPTSGKKAVQTRLTNYRDTMQFLNDQTIRGINMGMSPDELVEFVELPQRLKDGPFLQQVYITEDAVVRQLYNGYLGWFNTDAANINKVTPAFESTQIVTAFGGKDAVLIKAQEAMDAKNYPWSAQLTTYILNVDADDSDAKQLKANALRRMGQLSNASNNRNWYLTQARVLEGSTDVESEFSDLLGGLLTKDKIMENPGQFIRVLQAKIDPTKSADVNQVLGVNFTDQDKQVSLTVRGGIAIFSDNYPDSGVDIEMQLSSETWAEIILKEKGFLRALLTGDVKVPQGSVSELKDFMGMFDEA